MTTIIIFLLTGLVLLHSGLIKSDTDPRRAQFAVRVLTWILLIVGIIGILASMGLITLPQLLR